VVIKLAERIAHLREVKDAPEDERVLAAKECTNIYAPLANRLGIGQLKWELEDYCFRYLHPTEYKRIAKLLHERRLDREHYIEEFVGHLRAEMKAEGVKAEVYGRPKHIYSIWRKMQKKNLAFDELFDVRAVRIVAERLQDCYAALGIVHTHYRHLPDEFDDYVANPKPNGYQSIHTVVLGPGGKTVEIQIRTKQMHEDAELGVAAHWKYKEGAAAGGARSVSMSILNVERISTISTPRHNNRLASGCPCVCCRQYAQVSAKHSHDFWLVIPRLAIHFSGSNSPALLICALLTATIVLSFRDQTCRNRQIATI
jgi:GTP pyrophosphokinase